MGIEVMLDLETLGSKSPKSAIVAIGAVKMDMDVVGSSVHPEIERHQLFKVDFFYTTVSAEDCQRHGLVIEGDTVMWWLKQSEKARAALTQGKPDSLAWALAQFTQWVGSEPLPMWGNGSDFDCVLLRNAYNALDMQVPWKYHQSRCYRTLKNLYPADALKPPPNEDAHNALSDAQWQADHLFNILTEMRRAA